MSVTNIVNELIESHIISELKEAPKDYVQETTPGRTPILLITNPGTLLAMGLYISRDFCEVAIIDIDGSICGQNKTSFNEVESEQSFIHKITSGINHMLDEMSLTPDKLLGIGIASIGPLDLPSGTILEPPNFHGLVSIKLVEILKGFYQCPIYINNDMNASALAEKYYGMAKDNQDFIYVGITNGIGAGIITNNQLFMGHHGFSGEFGHTTVQMDGPLCVCGNKGCLELYANIPEVVRQFILAGDLGLNSSLTSPPTWPDIVEHAKKGDELCLKLIHRLANYVGIGLINLANLFDPETIVLGHDIALASDLILPYLNEEVNKRTFSSDHTHIKICVSKFIDHTPIIGSAALVFDALYEGDIEL